MSAPPNNEPDNSDQRVNESPAQVRPADDNKVTLDQLERTMSPADDTLDDKAKGHVNYDNIDKELAKYAGATRVEISPEENDRLRKMIDKRVLTIMIATYFLQALDKGTISFASIMGLPQDTGMVLADGVTVSQHYSWLTTCIYLVVLVVEYPQVSWQIVLEETWTAASD